MEILIVTTMRNEAPYCLEWIAHHLAAGASHFLIYTNDCDDGTDAILDALAKNGIVTHEALTPQGDRTVQWQALKKAWSHPRLKAADWVLVLDCDEFINLRNPLDGLPDLVSALPSDTEAIAMAWRLFGNNGQVETPRQLTVESYTRAAPEDIALPLAHFMKSMFRPAGFRQLGVHRPKRLKDHVPLWVDGSGRPLGDAFGKSDQRINLYGLRQGRDLVQLNHYSLRSAACFMAKRRRGLPNHMARAVDLGYWVERNFNSVEDTSIDRMLPATRAQLDELMAVDRVAELYRRALAHHETSLASQLRDPGENRLYMQLALSAGSRPPDPAFVRAHLGRLSNLENVDG